MNTLECKKPTPCVTDPVEPTRPEPSAASSFARVTILFSGMDIIYIKIEHGIQLMAHTIE